MYRYFYESPLGYIKIEANDEYLTRIAFVNEIDTNNTNTVIGDIVLQLDKYFNMESKDFNFIYSPAKESFATNVYKALTQIPFAELRTYKDVATMVGNDKASRAVGMANNKNNLPIIIPCHRVVGKSGMVGYAGGLDIKYALLNIEYRKFKSVILDLNGIDFDLLKYRCSQYTEYTIYENCISYILDNDRINVRYSNNALYVNFTCLDAEVVKNDVTKRFGLDIDYTDIISYFSITEFKDLFEQTKDYREVYVPNLFTATIQTIIHQFVSMKVAYTLCLRIVEKYGNKVYDLKAFPTAERLSKCSIEELKALGLSTAKASAVIETAKYFTNNSNVNLYDLITIKGIGRWTIQNLELFSTREYEVWPIDDIGLQEGLKLYLNDESRMSLKELTNLGSRLKYKSFLTIHIWAYLILGKRKAS